MSLPSSTTSSVRETNKLFISEQLKRISLQLFAECQQDVWPVEKISNLAKQCGQQLPLQILCERFSLTTFETDVLLMCAGFELSQDFRQNLNQATADKGPTFSYALNHFANAHWSALSPSAALRRWHLVDTQYTGNPNHNPLQIDERILHFLMGVSYLEPRLQGLMVPVDAQLQLVASHYDYVKQLKNVWTQADVSVAIPLVQLCGEREDCLAIAVKAASKMKLKLSRLSATDIASSTQDRILLARLWEREVALDNHLLIIECHDDMDDKQLHNLNELLNDLQSLVIVSSAEPLDIDKTEQVTFDIPVIASQEQKRAWQTELGLYAEKLNGQLDTLTMQFHFNADEIAKVSKQFLQQNKILQNHTDLDLADDLWSVCRKKARKKLDTLAQRVDSKMAWSDLILPASQKQSLAEMIAHLRQRFTVYESWGFASKSSRGLGISALFSGSSGTGKTLAAEIIANELNLDLYRIDLSGVINKYVGETEKNLKRIFDAAEKSGAILLFDEADSLFGKRSDVKDSQDRHANIEVSYLLQRMESYRGLAILTTNNKKALDQAFMRRLMFAIHFPFPDATQRLQIWQKIFPKNVPLGQLDFDKLARLDLAGGNIKNVALYAAFLAADANQTVEMSHLIHAARREYAKLEKNFNEKAYSQYVFAVELDKNLAAEQFEESVYAKH